MKKALLIASAAVAVLALWFLCSGTRGKGELTQRTFAISSPSRIATIIAEDNFSVEFSTDVAFGIVEVTAHENILEMVTIKTNTADRTLTIKLLDDVKFKGNVKPIARMRPISAVRSYEATDATFTFASKYRQNNCNVKLNKGGKFLGYALTSTNIKVDLAKGSEMEISTIGSAVIDGVMANGSELRYSGTELRKENIIVKQDQRASLEYIRIYTDSPAVISDDSAAEGDDTAAATK